MNKNLVRGLSAFLLVTALGGAISDNASASSWHKSAPKFLRGKWRTSLYKAGIYGQPYTRTYFVIGKNNVDGVNLAYTKNKHRNGMHDGCGWGVNGGLHYKKLAKNKYRLVVYSGFGKHLDKKYPMYYTIVRHGKKIKISSIKKLLCLLK